MAESVVTQRLEIPGAGPIPCSSILDAEACLSPSVLRTALQLSGLCVTHQYGIA